MLVNLSFVCMLCFVCQSAYALPKLMSLKELAQGAYAIVIGTVEEIAVTLSESAHTDVILTVEQSYNNKMPDEIVIRIPEEEEDQPIFKEKEKALVFIKEPEMGQHFYEVFGKVQGKRSIVDDMVFVDGQKKNIDDVLKEIMEFIHEKKVNTTLRWSAWVRLALRCLEL